jgi:Uma2 family endonuclease
MTTIGLPTVESPRGEDYFLFEGGGWELYDRLDDWAGERSGVKIVYLDGDVEVMGKSRPHDWFARRLNHLVWALARATGVACDDAGETTIRRKPVDAGSQADEAFYFGANAVRMAGPKEDDPEVDPPPDLVIEIQVSNPVKRALSAWARIGVPEVWHLATRRGELELRVLRRTEDGLGYAPVSESGLLPVSGAEILEILRPSLTEATQEWQDRLAERVAIVVARHAGGA